MRMEAIGMDAGLPRGGWVERFAQARGGVREATPAYAAQVTARELLEKQRDAVQGLKAALAIAAQATPPRRQQQLTAQLEELASTWRISPRNRALLEAQRPGLRDARSAAAWARLGRTPREGESPLHVIVPARGRTVPYLAAPVFDVSQTRGARLAPSPPVKGRTLLVALEEAWQELGQGRAPGGAREILEALVRARLGEERAVEAELRELEVAAACFVCLRALGAAPRAPAMAAWHGRSGAAILLSLSRIQRAARAVLAATRALDPPLRA